MRPTPKPGSMCSLGRPARLLLLPVLLALMLVPALSTAAGRIGAGEARKRLRGFDAEMAKILSDWNAPGVSVGVVVGDQLVFAQGYGYRDYGKKLPMTPATLCPIASNTKLFTAVAAGLLVDEGKLTWDRPVRESVPEIRFYNDYLNDNVTLRDMLAHRTGITRHDLIWYKADFTRKELFDRLRYLEPKEPLRQTFLYNNLMVSAAGYMIELRSGKTWEDFVRERILQPLGMNSTVYTIAEMEKQPEYGVPYTERRDSRELYRIPYYEETEGMAPCGAMISNVPDMSHWLIALMNDGNYEGKQVIPAAVLKATTEPAIAVPNTMGEVRGYWELINSVYGMGRFTGSYRGRLLSFHGGDINGFHSQVSLMPQEGLGVIVFVIGDHCASLYDSITYNIYERLLGMDETPWSARTLAIYLKAKEADKEARGKAGEERVPGTTPSHPLAAYAGEYEDPAYGVVGIAAQHDSLRFNFHQIHLPLSHFHYDRFDTPDDEINGKWSVNFRTDPQGNIDAAVLSMDEGQVSFLRRAEAVAPEIRQQLAGTYRTPSGGKFEVTMKKDGGLVLLLPGRPPEDMVHYTGLKFRLPQFSDLVFEFVVDGGRVKAVKQRDPSGETVFPKQ